MPNRIARKLILLLVVFSSLITLVLSATQLYFEYQRDRGVVESYFMQIERSYLKSLAENVWQEDRDRLKLLIGGIVEFPGFEFVQVKDIGGQVLVSIGVIEDDRTIRRVYPLGYHFRGSSRTIGELEVIAGLSFVYQRLLERVGVILLSNAIKTFLVALFLFIVIRWLLTSHLDLMTRFAKNMTLSQSVEPLQLRRGAFSGKEDEVDRLADALNEMQHSLARTYNSLKESEERFRQLAENINEVFWLGSPDWRQFYYVSPAFEKRWGFDIDYLYQHPQTWLDAVHPDDRQQVIEDIPCRLSEIGAVVEFREYRILDAKGKTRWIKARAFPIRDEGDRIIRMAGISEDISDRKKANDELKKLSSAIESSSSAVFMTDAQGLIEYVNPRFSVLTGYSREESVGQKPDFLRAGDQSVPDCSELLESSVAEDWKGEVNYRRKDHSEYRARMSLSAVTDQFGNVTHFIGIHDDISREHKLTERLNFQARHDALTGLYNRIEFESRAQTLFTSCREQEVEHALCFMDLDQFKVINDTCGHVAGDELLRQLSHVLTATVRQSDMLARLGGDEFGVLMEHCTLEQAHRLAESIRVAVQEFRFVWDDQVFHIGISIGLVSINRYTNSLTELLKQADAACYMAKDLGRNRIHEYHADDSSLVERQGEMLWVNRINQALEQGRFGLFAQAIIPLQAQGGEHYELLVRMYDEKGTIIPPGSFLPAAERFDLMEKVDAWVIQQAFQILSQHPRFVENIEFISINLSGASLTNGRFLDYLLEKLNQSRIPPEKVCFEVTETVAISNLSAAITFIKLLKQVGCRFALDDFGSGLSSFGYLKNLPVDYLKIDGMFVRDIVDDPIDLAMVKSINEIGQVMKMQTIAEFVENDQIKEKLIEVGVDFAQGYGVGKPEPFDQLIKSWNAMN